MIRDFVFLKNFKRYTFLQKLICWNIYHLLDTIMLIYSLNFVIKKKKCTDFDIWFDIFTKYLIISTTQEKLRAKLLREFFSRIFHTSVEQTKYVSYVNNSWTLHIYIYTYTHTHVYITIPTITPHLIMIFLAHRINTF